MLGSFRVPLPPHVEQLAIVRHLGTATAELDLAISKAQNQIDLFREYRTRLIADVVTGKLDVREAAARLPDEINEPEPIDEGGVAADGDESADDADLDAVPEQAEV